jgi:hypothetical protein
MGRLLFVMLMLVGAGCAPVASTQQTSVVHWRTLEAGRSEAAARQMPVLVDFYFGEGCHRCMAFDQKIYASPAIVERVNKNFVPVRVILTDELTAAEKELSERLATGGECMLAFLDSTGRIITDQQRQMICTMQMITPEQFLDYLDKALQNLQQ